MTRVVFAVTGALALAFGVFKLGTLGLGDLLHAVLWLGGGVVAHDALFAPVVLLTGVAGAALLPGWAKGPAVAGAVVLATVTIAVFPTLARVGAQPDLPSLLDRPYGLGWAAFTAIVAAGVVLGCARGRRRQSTARAKE